MVPDSRTLRIKSLGVAVLGFLLSMSLLNFMNSSPELDKKKSRSQVQFETKKLKKKNRHRLPKKKIEKKHSQKMRSLKPKMDLAFANTGIDLGIDILGLSAGDSQLLSQQGDTVMTEDVVDNLPRVQYREQIPYPDFAKEQNITGYVTLNILVNKRGEVDQVKLLESQPEGIFDQVALNSIKRWSFTPAEYKGKFVSVWVKQKLRFQVN